MNKYYINDLDEISTKIQYEETITYFKEAVLCYNVGAYRASTILLWLAIFTDLLKKIEEMSYKGDPVAEEIIRQYKTICENNDTKQMLDFEKNILEKACDKLLLISSIEQKHLARIKDDRNYAAHPLFSVESKNHHYKEQIKTYILQAANYLFIQPPISGKYKTDEIFNLIQQSSFPITREEAYKVLYSNNHLGRVKPIVIKNLMELILNRLFSNEEPLNIKFQHNQLTSSLHAISQIKNDEYKDKINRYLPKILSKSTNDLFLKRFICLYSDLDFPISKLETDTKIRILNLITTMNVDDTIRYRVSLAASIDEEVNQKYQEFIKSLHDDELIKLLSSSQSLATKNIAINIFITSRSFYESYRYCMEILVPHSRYFTLDDLKRIFNELFDNSKVFVIGEYHQIFCAGGIENAFISLYDTMKNNMKPTELVNFKKTWVKLSTDFDECNLFNHSFSEEYPDLAAKFLNVNISKGTLDAL